MFSSVSYFHNWNIVGNPIEINAGYMQQCSTIPTLHSVLELLKVPWSHSNNPLPFLPIWNSLLARNWGVQFSCTILKLYLAFFIIHVKPGVFFCFWHFKVLFVGFLLFVVWWCTINIIQYIWNFMEENEEQCQFTLDEMLVHYLGYTPKTITRRQTKYMMMV